MKLIAALSLAALTFTAHARLGETEGQSQTRYGAPRADLLGADDKPLMAGAVEKQYLYESFRVRAAFVGGVCHVIEYVHIPENSIPKPLGEAEVKGILAAESGLDATKLTAIPAPKRQEAQLKRWKEDGVKEAGPYADIARGIKGALKLNKWERTDGAVAEYALGLVLKISSKDAESLAKRFARDAKTKPGAKPGVKPVVPNIPKF